ncbi:hypothetical protein N7536_007732 [Penicillium majusculum]|nr:hypothetical protein N7536_007732 [Penicillium majusculum]
MRTPEPPDRDEHGDLPPRLSRPKRTTRPPNNYAREQENDNEQRKTRSQHKNGTQIGLEAQIDATTSDDSSTESEDLSTGNLGRNQTGDEVHREELQKVQEEFWKAKEEFGAALAGVRHELQTLTDRPPTPQSHTEAFAQNNHDEILYEIQSLRDAISPSVPTGSPSYTDVARRPGSDPRVTLTTLHPPRH